MSEQGPKGNASTMPSSSSGQVECPGCGTLAPVEQRFCGQCGRSLHRDCPSCGAENPLHHQFCGQCGAELPKVSAAEAQDKPAEAPRLEERRWVTVLFADVSEFTSMSEQMDPEDVKALADRWTRRLSAEVRRFGGTVINVVGDEIVAVFGAPLAHEDDAERAVRAGLAITALDLSEESDQLVRVHVGINTGEVMAGLVGPRDRRDYTVMGDTVNTGARLLSAAPPGTVLVGAETFRATQQVVHYVELSPISVKGKGQPVAVWQALEVAPVPQARPLGAVPLIGRDQELERLASMWARVVADRQPHLVTIFGEAGIGKSRLVAEFEHGLTDEAVILHGRCLPYGEALSYGALAMMMKEAAGIEPEDDNRGARAKLGRLVESTVVAESIEDDPRKIARHLALMSGVDVEEDRLSGTSDERAFRSSARRFIQAFAVKHPLCLMLDDLHWADDTLMSLMEYIASRSEAPLMIVAISRPELLEQGSSWGRGVASFTSLLLKPLAADTEQELIRALCREHGLPDEVAFEIRRSAGGNPLFAEELVAMVAESGEEAGIPSAIKLLISARLDNLPVEERHVLQVASVFGTVFWIGGLRALVGGEVLSHLESLEHKGLMRALSRSIYPGEREYVIKHDLIRDVAYEILPRSERRLLHRRVADWIESTAGDNIADCYDLIAHHAVQAGRNEQAINYLIKAAERAGLATAHRQQAALLATAIKLAEQEGQSTLIPELRAKRGQAFMRIGMWAEAQVELEAAREALPPEKVEERIRVLSDLGVVYFWLIDPDALRLSGEEALELAEQLGRDDLAAGAMAILAQAHQNDGDLETGLDMSRQAFIRAGETPVPQLSTGAIVQGLVSHWRGDFSAAIEFQSRAITIARASSNTVYAAVALPQLGMAYAGSGRYDRAEQVFEEARKFGEEYELWPFVARALAMSAGYHLDLFDYSRHEAIAEEAREMAASLSFPPPLVSASVDLLFNFARRGEVGRALRLADEVSETIEKFPGFHGWLWRKRFALAQAEIALAREDWEQALQYADSAIRQSAAVGRVKYQALGMESRARALLGMGRKRQAIGDMRSAVGLIGSIGDPAIFLRVATTLLSVEGDDSLLAESQATADEILAHVNDASIVRKFEQAEPIRLLRKLGA